MEVLDGILGELKCLRNTFIIKLLLNLCRPSYKTALNLDCSNFLIYKASTLIAQKMLLTRHLKEKLMIQPAHCRR